MTHSNQEAGFMRFWEVILHNYGLTPELRDLMPASEETEAYDRIQAELAHLYHKQKEAVLKGKKVEVVIMPSKLNDMSYVQD